MENTVSEDIKTYMPEFSNLFINPSSVAERQNEREKQVIKEWNTRERERSRS